jgi:hypothetical protein
MFDSGIRDMLAMDRDKSWYGHWTGVAPLQRIFVTRATAVGDDPHIADVHGTTNNWVGLNRPFLQSGLTNDTLIGGGPVVSLTPAGTGTPGTISHLAGLFTGPPVGVSGDGHYPNPAPDTVTGYDGLKPLFAPQKAWKYAPFGMRLKFSIVRKRTYYNISNVIQSVRHYLMSRKRSQILALNINLAQSETGPNGTQQGDAWQVLDLLPARSFGRTGYNQPNGTAAPNSYGSNASTAAVFFVEGNADDPTNLSGAAQMVQNITTAGEYYRKFLWFRELPLQANAASSHLNYINSFGGNFSIAPRSTNHTTFYGTTVDTRDTIGQFYQKPYASATAQTTPTDATAGTGLGPSGTVVDYSLAPNWNPQRNAFLKRLFKISRKSIELAPGQAATIVHRSRSRGRGVPLWNSGVMSKVNFFTDRTTPQDGRDYSTYGKAFPYNNAYTPDWMPPTGVYGTKRRNGFQTSDLWVTCIGQNAYDNQSTMGTTKIGPTPGSVAYKERIIVKFRVCSYARPHVGGNRWYNDELDSSTDVTKYASFYPTAAPAFSTITLE